MDEMGCDGGFCRAPGLNSMCAYHTSLMADSLRLALANLEAACAERDEHTRPLSEDHPARVAARELLAYAEGK